MMKSGMTRNLDKTCQRVEDLSLEVGERAHYI